MVTMPGTIESYSPEGEEQTRAITAREPAPYKPDMGLQVKPGGNPYEAFTKDTDAAESATPADPSWKERFVQHFNNAQRYGTPGVYDLTDIRDAQQGYVGGVQVGKEAAQATANLRIDRRAESVAAYENMPSAQGPLDYAAAIGGEIAGTMADPASLLGAPVKIGTAGWRMAYPFISRLLESSVSNAAMNAAVNATVQAEEYGAGQRDEVDWLGLGMDAAAGAAFGLPFGAAEGSAASRLYAEEAQRNPAPAPAPYTPAAPRETPPATGMAPPTPEQMQAEFTPQELSQAQVDLFGEVVGTRNLTPEQAAQVDDYINAGRTDIPQAEPETQGGLTLEDVPPPPEPKPDLSTDPATVTGTESVPALQIGGKYFTGQTHAEALDKALQQFGPDSPEIRAFEAAENPLDNIGVIRPKQGWIKSMTSGRPEGFAPGITGGNPKELTGQIDAARGTPDRPKLVGEDARYLGQNADGNAVWERPDGRRAVALPEGKTRMETPDMLSGPGFAPYERPPEFTVAPEAAPAAPPPPLPIDRTERQFSPSELKVDAKRFQFKEGGDEAGVTERLKGVKKWDPIKSGVTLVWEDLKGDFYIADGHQRHGLASRLEKDGQEPKIRAVVLREADGVSAEDARAIAAAKNIAEGTGNAIDAAKILRSRPDMGVDLPPTSALVRDAQGLASLSDDAFGMVVNKTVPAGYAAQVGRLAPDPKTHTELLGLLAKEKPENAIEAESMIRDALDAPAVQSTMEDMFGSAEVTQILFKERAQVLSAAATAIRKDRAAFNTLVKEEARLTGAGNQLATASNAERATQDAEILATLQAQARRKGPVADALAAAAKQLHDGASRQAVVRDFLDGIRGASAATGADRGIPGDAGRAGEAGIAARLEPRGQAPALPTNSKAFKTWFGNSKVVDEKGEPLVVYHGTGPTSFGEFKLDAAKKFDKGFFGADGFYLTPQRYLADAYSMQRGGTAANTMELYVSIENPLWLHGSTTQPDEIVENLQRALVKHFGDQAQADEVMRRITGGKTALEIQNLLFAEETSARGEEAATWESHGGLHSSTILDEFRKNIIPEVRKLGYDGIFAGTVWNKDYTHRVPSEIVAFDPTQIKSATGNSGDFDPNEPAIAFSRRPVQEGPGLFDAAPLSPQMERLLTLASGKMGAPDNILGDQINQAVRQGWVEGRQSYTATGNRKTRYFLTDKGREALTQPKAPSLEPGADNLPQSVIPGAERISDKSLAERRAAAPLRASKPQKSMDVGLFGSEADQKGFAFSTQTIGTGLPDMIARGAPIEEISAHPVVQEAVRRLDAIPLTNEQPGFMSDSWKAARIYDFEDGPVQGFDKAIDRLEEGAKAFSKAGPVKNERRAIIVLGPPAAGKSTFAERFATERYAAIVDPDEAKKVIPEFQGGIGANAVHEESADMANAVLDHLLDEGSNLVIPKVGHSASGIRKLVQRLKRDGYQVDLVNIAVSYDNAFRRMIGRFIKTGRIINPEYVKAVGISPAETYRLLKQEGVADRYAEIDANGRAGDPPQVLDNTGALEGLSGFGGDRKPLLGTDVRGQGQAPEQAAPPDSGVAFARRPQQGTMPSNRPQAGTVATGNAASPPLAPRLEDIGADLRTLTGAPVRQGRLQRAPAGGGKVAGQYDRDQGVIRLRENPDFETQVHETAHSLETEWGRSLNTIKLASKAELEPLAYAGADPRQQLSEGFAEWFRFYVTTPIFARNQAPGFTAAFEDMLRTRAPEQLAAIEKIQADYRAHVTAPSRAAVAGDVVSTRRGNAVGEVIKEAQSNGIHATLATYASTAYTTLIDKLNPIAKAVDELAKVYEKRTGRALDITSAQDPYRLARLLQDSYSAGHVDATQGVVPYHGVVPEGPSLSDALALAFHDGWSGWNERDMADFASYLISRRAVWEYDRFLAGELPNAPGKFTKGDYETTIAELEAQYPQWVQAADMVYEWQKNFLRKKKDAGFITQELYDELIQRPAYVPFMRDLTDLDKEVGREGNATLRNSIVKAFKGSKRSIINPIESMMADAYHFNALLRRNDVFKALEDLGRMAGPGGGSIVERIPSSELKGTAVNVNEVLKVAGKEAGLNPNDIDSLTTMVDDLMGEDARATVFRAGEINEKGEPIVYVWRNGKKQALRLPDGDFGRELFDSMTGMNKESRDLFVSVLALPSSALRYSITTSPPFVLANYIRDQVSAWVLSGETFIPFVTGARGLRDEIMQGEISRIYNSFGGIMGGANVASLDKGRMKRDISALQRKGYAIKRFAGISGFAQFTELSETGTRLGIFGNAYKRAKKEGLSDYEAAVEAAYQARDYIDFGRHGSKTHAARRLVTFLNASVQGLDKTFRVLTAEGALRKAITPYVNHRAGRPLSARDKANLGRSAKAWAALSAVGVLGLGLRVLYKDDPEYEEISDYLRATNWMIKVRPGEWIAVPKPFELGFVSNLFERSFEAIYQRNPVAMESFWSGLFEITAPPSVVPIFDVGYQLAHNVDSYGRPIVGQDIAGYEPWRQYTAQTSALAKGMGYATNTSPAMIDHAIQGFGASWGKIITDISRDTAQERGPVATMTGALTRRFVKDVASGSVSSAAFWGQMSETSGPMAQTANTYKDIFENQGPAAGNAFLETKDDNLKAYAMLTTHFDAKVERLHPMRRAKDAVSAISSLRKEIAGNDVTPVGSDPEDHERIVMTPDQRHGVQELLARLAMVEARNALVTTGIRGFAQKQYMDTETIKQDIATLSPQLGEELTARYEKKKIYDEAAVREAWPDVKQRILTDGQDANFDDITSGMGAGQ